MNMKKLTKADILKLIDKAGISQPYLKKLTNEELIVHYQNYAKLDDTDEDVIVDTHCLVLATDKFENAVQKVKDLKLLEMNSDEWIDFIIQKAREAKNKPIYKNKTLSSLIDGQDFYHKRLIEDAKKAATDIDTATSKEYRNIIRKQLQGNEDWDGVKAMTENAAKELFANVGGTK